MKQTFVMCLFLAAFVWLGAKVQVLSQSEDMMELEFTLPEYSIGHEEINGINWDKIISDDGSVTAEEGFPELRCFSEAIAIPVDGDISLQVTNSKSSVIPNVNLIPSYKMVVDNQKEEVDYVFYQDTRAYHNPQLYPLNILEKGDPAFIGDRNFIALHIYPFQYRAASKELFVNARITIRVLITGKKTGAKNWQLSENPVDGIGDSFFINNATSKSWRLPKNRDNSYQTPKSGTSSINEIQFIIDKEGIYKVTYAELDSLITAMTDSLDMDMAWGLETVDPRYLELTDEKGAVPIFFQGESDGDFDSQDYFEFYGDRHYGDECYSDDYTAENVYTLALNNTLGARMAVENGGLVVSNAAQYIVPDAFESTVHFEKQLILDKLGNSWTVQHPDFFREDVWFWRKINAPDLDIIPFELQYPKDSTIRTAKVKASLYGLTYAESLLPTQYDHEATVRINEAMINSHTWVGQTEQIFQNQNPVANSYFNHGTNYMYISLSGNTVSENREQVLLDYLDLTYWREYKTDEDFINFSKPSNRPAGLYQFELQGFNSGDVTVYKIGSSIFNNCQIEPFNIEGVAPWTVTLQDSVASTEVKYFAVTENQKKTPKSMRLNVPSDLKNPANHGDVILVSKRDLLECQGADMLVSNWEAENHVVARVDIQDIYDEFNHGIRSGEALKEFLQYAYNNWGSPQMTHVLLMGEGIEDNRDDSPANKYVVIPAKKVWTSTHGATAADGWYAMIVGSDQVPDIALSRINCWLPEQVLNYANKATSYRNTLQTSRLWNSQLTISSGGKITDTTDLFAQQSERIRRKTLPPESRVTRVYTSTQTVSSDYFGGTFNLKDAINNGTQYIHFFGHGGGRIWSDYNLLNFNDVATLNNQVYPIVMSMACYCSAFDTNGINSISEVLVMEPGKGAIATLGFSGLGYQVQDEDWALSFTEALYKDNVPTLGEAFQMGLARFYTTSLGSVAKYALTYAACLLGDPLIQVRRPIKDIPVVVDNYTPMPGDRINISAQFPSDVTAARLYVMKNNEKIVNVPYDLPVINGVFNASYDIPADIPAPYSRKVHVAGYSSTNEYVGETMFGVGRAAIMHHATFPVNPAWSDSVGFIARIFSNETINSAVCKVCVDSIGTITTWVDIPMEPDPEIENGYRTSSKIPSQLTGEEIRFKYIINTPTGTYESAPSTYVTRGPDLLLGDIKLENNESGMNIKILVRNVGNSASLSTDLKLFMQPQGGIQTLYAENEIQPLDMNQERWEVFQITNINPGLITFNARVNTSAAFPEWAYSFSIDNGISLTTSYNYYTINSTGGLLHSLDNNLVCQVPENLVPSVQSSTFYINSLGALNPNNQPDITALKLLSSDTITTSIPSNAYLINTSNPALADSNGILINNKQFTLTFYYSAVDPDTQEQETENSFKIYRWEETGDKWILEGGNTSYENNLVIFEVSRLGIYTIYRNTDRIRPSIDVNVQDQEFTVGGYISGTGTLSMILSDANGIDVFNETIKLYLNGNLISPSDYVVSINMDNLNRIPIKYQLNLTKGNYTLVIDCKDVNGNFNTREIQFVVNETFMVKNIGNYPNPILGRAVDPKNDGRTRFTYVLTDDADEVTIKVYSVLGRLVKTFDNLPTGVGYHEYPRTVYGWDCKDDFGYSLANGVYFYKLIAVKGNKRLENTMKMAILK
jgi:hypothetical protein